MSFAETFASFNLRTSLLLQEAVRRDAARFQGPKVPAAFTEAVSLLGKALDRINQTKLLRAIPSAERHKEQTGETLDAKTEQLLDLSKRFVAFPDSLRYFYSNDHTVLLWSEDRWMERALTFGTRDLPRLRPIDFLVRRMLLRLGPTSLVFMARDFRKHYEYADKEWKRENLRVVTGDYTQ